MCLCSEGVEEAVAAELGGSAAGEWACDGWAPANEDSEGNVGADGARRRPPFEELLVLL